MDASDVALRPLGDAIRRPSKPAIASVKPIASERVTKALEAGWSSACNGLAALSWFAMRRRANEEESMFIDVLAGERRVEIYLSPTGRSVRVYVDGKESQ